MSRAITNKGIPSCDGEDFRAATVMERADSDPRNSQNSGDLAVSFSLPDKLAVPHARKLLLFSVGILCVFSSSVFAQGKKTQKKPKIDFSKPLYSISKETTFVTGPLTKDGHIDFVAAINNRYSKGVTQENNAVVMILQALGPFAEGNKLPDKVFKQLGMPKPPIKGDYFLGFYNYLTEKAGFKDTDEVNEKFDRLDQQRAIAQKQVWKATDYPHVANWLKYNEQSLKLVIEGTRRSRYFMPVMEVWKDDDGVQGLCDSWVPIAQHARGFARALVCRAMLKINEEKFEEAWQDLLACHRLARHTGQSFWLIQAMASFAIENIAYRGDLILLEHSKPTAAQVSQYLKDLSELRPLPDTIEKYDFGERLSFLSSVVLISRNFYTTQKKANNGLLSSSSCVNDILEDTELYSKRLLTPYPNWIIILKQANRSFDHVVRAQRIQNRKIRALAFEDFDVEFAKYRDLRPNKIEVKAALKSNEEISKRIGNILVGLMLPDFQGGLEAEHRTQQHHNNLLLAFALAGYKSDQKRYPEKLAELSPKYLTKIPEDIFTGQPLKYKASQDGYLLYSVGINGKDDKGESNPELRDGPDDIAIKMPIPKE